MGINLTQIQNQINYLKTLKSKLNTYKTNLNNYKSNLKTAMDSAELSQIEICVNNCVKKISSIQSQIDTLTQSISSASNAVRAEEIRQAQIVAENNKIKEYRRKIDELIPFIKDEKYLSELKKQLSKKSLSSSNLSKLYKNSLIYVR